MSFARTVVAFALTGIAACGGAKERPPDTTAADSLPPAGLPASTPVPTDTKAVVALGGDIFNGRAAGGICFTCHGQNGAGTQLAPSLRDQTWINGDGSLDFITTTIRTGVPNPRQHPAAMPPFAGTLSDDQIRAVAAYVYSLSRPGGS